MGAFRHGPGCNCCGGGGNPTIPGCGSCDPIPATLYVTDGNGTTTMTYDPVGVLGLGPGWYGGPTPTTCNCPSIGPFPPSCGSWPGVSRYFVNCNLAQIRRATIPNAHPTCYCYTEAIEAFLGSPSSCSPVAGTYNLSPVPPSPPTTGGSSMTLSE